MNAEIIKVVGFWLAILLAAPLSFALFRAAMFFGSLRTTVEELDKSMKAFTTWATEHGNRLAVVETRVDGMAERRNGDDRRHE
jgi:hypothetical protein